MGASEGRRERFIRVTDRGLCRARWIGGACGASCSPGWSVLQRPAPIMPRLLFVYSHQDESFRDQLEAHLAPLRREGVIETWHDRKIGPGRHVDHTISALEEADIILFLVSSDF